MLTPAQLMALKADMAGNSNTIPAGQSWTGSFAGQAVSAVPNTGDGNAAIAGWYRQVAVPDFNVFRTNVGIEELYDQVTWANFTPQDVVPVAAVPASPTAAETYALSLWTGRSLACQGKQFNLQMLLQGRSSLNAGKINQRAGLNDATTNVPSGAAGASKSGGWTGILAILRRLANNIEVLFAAATTGVGTGTGALGATGNPGLMNYEGSISGDDVQNARNS